MITYLISFTLCSGLLLLVYHGLFAREQMFRFNRFYLIGSLIFSLTVPLTTINTGLHFREQQPVAVAQPSVMSEQIGPVEPVPFELQANSTSVTEIDWVVIAIWIYSAIALALLGRFSINLYRVIHKRNITLKTELAGAKLFLTDRPLPPHSFFSNIYLNRSEFESGAICEQVIAHEQAHARQLHSLDILLVELMQAVCWFNPIIILYRRAIQQNHEYLADAAVVDYYKDTVGYQYLILSMSGVANQSKMALSSAFNYQTLKSRLLMLTKTTTRGAALCRQLAVLPVIAIAVLLFSQKTEAQPSSAGMTKISNTKPTQVTANLISDTPKPKPYPVPNGTRPRHAASDASENITTEYASILKKYNLSDTSGKISDITPADRTRMHELYTQMSARQQDAQWIRFSKMYMPPSIRTNDTSLERWKKDGATYGVWIDGKRIKNEDLADYKAADFANVNVSRLTAKTVRLDGFKIQVNLETNAYRANYLKKALSNREDRLEHIRLVKMWPSKHEIELTSSTSD